MLVNLAVNARDAMPSGGRLSLSTANVSVGQVEARRYADGAPGDFVRLRVVDTGFGMTGDVVARVFEPFFTTKDQGKGTGLGLSTVFGIVRQSQGFVGVTSAPGAGSTFDGFLPRDAAHPAAVAPGPTGSRRGGRGRGGPGRGGRGAGPLPRGVAARGQGLRRALRPTVARVSGSRRGGRSGSTSSSPTW